VYDHEEKERIKFEEEHFIRLPTRRKDKLRLKKKMNEALHPHIDDFHEMDDFNALLQAKGLIPNSSSNSLSPTLFTLYLQG